MLDLSMSFGNYEGITFYGDHKDNNIVYYFPNEIKLATKNDEEKGYELALQVYYENKLVDSASEYDLEKTAGSFLQLSVNCTVSPQRLEKAFAALRKDHSSIPSQAKPTPPLWTDGNVHLITLGESSFDKGKTNEIVKTIVSSQRPSLTKDLKSIFSVHYDRMGTELIYSAIKSGQGCSVAVVYDLSFAGIRPAFDLKMSANLRRCQETVKKNLGFDLELPIKQVHLDLHTQFEWLTQEMVKNGDIKIEHISQLTSDEERKEEDKLANEFKEKVLQELFSPITTQTDSPEKINALSKVIGIISPVKLGLSYKFNKQVISEERVIQVDYSERSAVIRHHSPQAIILDEGNAIANHFDKYVKTVVLGTNWVTKSVNVRLFYDFEKEDSDLECAEIVIWKHKDGINSNMPANCFALPDKAKPLGDFTFTAFERVDDRRISWACDENDDGGFYYQLRLIYSCAIRNCYTPKEIVSRPILSYSNSISIIPNSYSSYKNIPMMIGRVDFSVFDKVEVVIDVEDATGKVVVRNKRILLNEENNENRYIVRGTDSEDMNVWVSKVFYFKEKGMPALKYPPYLLQDYAIVIDDSLTTKEISLDISGDTEQVDKISISYIIKSIVTLPRQTCHIDNFNQECISITTFDSEDVICYEVSKVYKDENNKRRIKLLGTEEILAKELCRITINLDN